MLGSSDGIVVDVGPAEGSCDGMTVAVGPKLTLGAGDTVGGAGGPATAKMRSSASEYWEAPYAFFPSWQGCIQYSA